MSKLYKFLRPGSADIKYTPIIFQLYVHLHMSSTAENILHAKGLTKTLEKAAKWTTSTHTECRHFPGQLQKC